MSAKTIIFAVVLIASASFLIYNIRRLISYLKLAKPEKRWDKVGKRIIHTLKVAIFQSKILRDKFAGPIHAGIFWGFLVFLFSASEAVIQGFFPGFTWSFLGPVYTVITFSTDLFILIITIAVIFALIRRRILKVDRLNTDDPSEVTDAMLVLGMILVITISLLFQNSALTVLHPNEEWAFRPLSSAIGSIISAGSAQMVYEICWWVHIIAILAFANYLPYSKHLHVYTSVLNVFFSPLEPSNKLEPIDFEDESAEKFGVVDFEDFKWKTVFDGYSCTHCGRCTSVCPANITGKELDPREIIVQVRERTMDKGPIMIKQQKSGNGEDPALTEEEQKIMEKTFIGDYESVEALWQCTTCGACVQECPVMIEHVPAIIDLRRSLVMMEANFPQELQPSFQSLENNSTPWAFSAAERADWAEGLDIKTAAENPDFDVLFWVGCAGSFDDRAKKISIAFAKLLQEAGINFAILGTEEQCNGDVARRAGNEYLADMLMKMNVETLNRYNVKKMVTICPHCFNIFKNEYPDFGGNYEVIHHTVFLDQLIKEGKLKLKKNGEKALDIAYHDSCYMGRYNDVYDEPRNVIQSIPASSIKEVKRSRDKGLCCGAGGGQMFMEENKGKRVNMERTEELLETGSSTIASNCPFCMTMLTDGVKAKDKIEEVAVKDVAEIILENLDNGKE